MWCGEVYCALVFYSSSESESESESERERERERDSDSDSDTESNVSESTLCVSGCLCMTNDGLND